ncbi:MAG: hypothetical protein KME45_08260 [Stenomitos rutilans HA7619-LM2]|jgi:hypothetical protein|nr:hypothetical protein [Stenomitos rutilans HA7619-LM2]
MTRAWEGEKCPSSHPLTLAPLFFILSKIGLPNHLYKRQIFMRSDYEDASFAASNQKLKKFWDNFLDTELKIIDKAIFEQMADVAARPIDSYQNGE